MNPRMYVAGIVAAGALAAGGALWTGGAAAADPVTWKLDWGLVEGRSESKLVKEFVERVNKRTEGKFKIDVYFGGSLGINQADALRALKSGGIDMSLLYAGYLSRDLPELTAAYATAASANFEEIRKIAPVLAEINAEGFTTWDITTVANVMIPAFDWHFMCKTPVGDLKTLRTKKVRANDGTMAATFALLKVNAQIVPQAETYLALQTGVIDCTVYPVAIAKTISLQEVAKFASYFVPHSAMPIAIGVGNAKWASLDPAIRQVVMEEGQALWKKSLDDAVDPKIRGPEVQAVLSSSDIKLLPPFPDADRKEIVNAIRTAWAELAAKAGRRAPEWRERVLKALK